ncbi:heat-inducible transcription repressor HrcA [Erysipelothrix sp. HDW6C]|uniref:heat-inducible transcriptional repressor HrcA n=1 Tax=Erysipelothrix sp. HDW6C TaxID=2714930 RepID=UPI00140CA113|nr:heat-inducible transcriptional repressor HrcA [Erysipelothrix sp. HDW6C]QIK70264.1 heat-inducible transcription repressor HrcA [Erysipelothrix sp. HDW6C]
MLTPRKVEIFRAIVTEFINTAEPVGSNTLIEKFNLPYSSATIRNEMSDLEKEGLIEKTHTSSGRVPSTKGYRFYVEHLMEDEGNRSVENAIAQVFSDRRLDIDEAIRQSSDIISHMTNLTAVVLGPSAADQILKSVQLIPLNELSAMAVFVTESGHAENRIFNFESQVSVEDIEQCTVILNERLKGTKLGDIVEKMEGLRPILSVKLVQYEVLFEAFVGAFVKFAQSEVYLSGERNMLYQPEFSNIEKLRQLMGMLENSEMWREISINHENLRLTKGSHSELVWVDDMAVVSSKFQLTENSEHQLMVVGPNRMEYGRVVSLIDYVSEMVEKVYGKGGQDEQREDEQE